MSLEVSNILPPLLPFGTQAVPGMADGTPSSFQSIWQGISADPYLTPSAPSDHVTETTEQQIEQAARQLVASTFIVPILSALRESPFQTSMFGPTMAEKRLGPVFDQQLADRIVAKAEFPLVSRIKEQFLEAVCTRQEPSTTQKQEVVDVIG